MQNTRAISPLGVAILTMLSSSIVCGADPFIALRAHNADLLPYEPIVVHITLTTAPDAGIGDGVPIGHVARGFPKGLVGRVFVENREVCDVYFGGGGFGPRSESQDKAHATMLGVLGTFSSMGGESAFLFFGVPGVYQLELIDEEFGLRSDPVSIHVVEARGREAEAGRLFSTGGSDLLLALQTLRVSKALLPLLESVDRRFSDTVLGQYAGAMLAGSQAEAEMKQPIAEAPGERCHLLKRLTDSTDRFFPGHPLRTRALLTVARIGAECRNIVGPGDPLGQLNIESTDGYYRSLAAEMRATRTRGPGPDNGTGNP